jgi:membrane-associated phospholipid phosphatase
VRPRLYPEELIAIGASGLMAIVFLLLPQPLRWSDPVLYKSLLLRLVMPMFLYLVMCLLWRIAHLKPDEPFGPILWQTSWHSLRLWGAFYLTLIVHFNIKINLGVWRDRLYDPGLLVIDRWLGQWFDWATNWHRVIDQFYDFTQLYGFVFETMFLLSFIILRLGQAERKFREMFAAIILVNLLGSLGYIAWPALGPFITADPASPYMQTVLATMYSKYYSYVSSGGLDYVPSFLTQGLAAMPSLHLANAIVFSYFIWRDRRGWLPLYILITGFIAVEALYSKFHYFTDLVIGTEIAVIAIILALWLYAWYDRSATHRHSRSTHPT